MNLEEKKYPFDCIAVQYMGYPLDNSPPALSACNAVILLRTMQPSSLCAGRRGLIGGRTAWDQLRVRPAYDTSNRAAAGFGWGARLPLGGRVAPASAPNNLPASGSTLALLPDNILVVNARPALDGKSAKLDLLLNMPGKKLKAVDEVNVLEVPDDRAVPSDYNSGEVTLPPFGVKFIRLVLS